MVQKEKPPVRQLPTLKPGQPMPDFTEAEAELWMKLDQTKKPEKKETKEK